MRMTKAMLEEELEKWKNAFRNLESENSSLRTSRRILYEEVLRLQKAYRTEAEYLASCATSLDAMAHVVTSLDRLILRGGPKR
jgi:predicted nuclease with TOPRIM domain